MHYFISVLKKYAVFSGRARRAEYWYFALFSTIISIVLAGIDVLIGSGSESTTNIGLLGGIYSLAILLPALGVSVRRLHDIGKSGWFILVSLIPLIGSIWLLILMIKDSTPQDNAYGPNPKGVAASAQTPAAPATPTATT